MLTPQTAARPRGAAAAAAADASGAPAKPLRLKIDAEGGADNVWLDRAQLADMLAALAAAAAAAKAGEAGEANGAAGAMGRLQAELLADKIIRVCGVRSLFSPDRFSLAFQRDEAVSAACMPAAPAAAVVR